jgi:hypothetical protein
MLELELIRDGVLPDEAAVDALLTFAEKVDALFSEKRGPAEEFLLRAFGAREDLHDSLAKLVGESEDCKLCSLAVAEREYRAEQEPQVEFLEGVKCACGGPISHDVAPAFPGGKDGYAYGCDECLWATQWHKTEPEAREALQEKLLKWAEEEEQAQQEAEDRYGR